MAQLTSVNKLSHNLEVWNLEVKTLLDVYKRLARLVPY